MISLVLAALSAANDCADLSLLQLRTSSRVVQAVFRFKGGTSENGFAGIVPADLDPALGMTPTTTLTGVVSGTGLDVLTFSPKKGESRSAPVGLRIPLEALEEVLKDGEPLRQGEFRFQGATAANAFQGVVPGILAHQAWAKPDTVLRGDVVNDELRNIVYVSADGSEATATPTIPLQHLEAPAGDPPIFRFKGATAATNFVGTLPDSLLGQTWAHPNVRLRGTVDGDALSKVEYAQGDGWAPAPLALPLSQLTEVSSNLLPAEVEPAWERLLAARDDLTWKLRMVPDKKGLWQKLRQLGPGHSPRIPENYYHKVSERGDTPVWYRRLNDAPDYLPWGGRLVHRDSADLPAGHLADRPDADLVHNRGAIDGRGIGWGTQAAEQWPRRENVGWGGTCTCPDGSVYIVGDEGTNCEYLACEHGTPSQCERKWAPGRDMMKVTCAQLDGASDLAGDLYGLVEQAFKQLDAAVNVLAGKTFDLNAIDAHERLAQWHARQPTPVPTPLEPPPTVAPQTLPSSPAPTPRVESDVGPLWKGRNEAYPERLLSPGDGSWSTGAAIAPDAAPVRAPADPGPMPLDRPPATESGVDAALRSSSKSVSERTVQRTVKSTLRSSDATTPPLWALGR